MASAKPLSLKAPCDVLFQNIKIHCTNPQLAASNPERWSMTASSPTLSQKSVGLRCYGSNQGGPQFFLRTKNSFPIGLKGLEILHGTV